MRFAKNKQRISEVYAFDARGTDNRRGEAMQWFHRRSDAVLRMTGGYQLTANEATRRSIEKLAGGPVPRVTATPPSEKAYSAIRLLWAEQRLGKSQGGIHLGRFGVAGYIAHPGPLAVTFLQQFLQESLF